MTGPNCKETHFVLDWMGRVNKRMGVARDKCGKLWTGFGALVRGAGQPSCPQCPCLALALQPTVITSKAAEG